MAGEIRRVLMTGDAVGGVWTYALDLARALGDRGVAVMLATMGPSPAPDQLAAAAAIPTLTLAVSGCKLEWMDDAWDDVDAAGRWLLEFEREWQPDIVHLNGYAHGALSWRAPTVVVGHSCLVSWADAVPGAIADDKLEAYSQRVAPGLRRADIVAAPSAAMLASLQRHYGPFARAAVVPNGRSAERFHMLRKEPFVFSAGRSWDRAKNMEALVSIAARLSWPVAIAGDDDAAAPLGGAGVRRLGRLSEQDITEWLARAAIFALPARYEPFGLLPLEAALSGCALVLGDTPSLREVWGDAADYVDPLDPEALRLAILRLIASPGLLEARARAARARAAEYSPGRMAEGYLALYRSVVGGGPLPLRERTNAAVSEETQCAS